MLPAKIEERFDMAMGKGGNVRERDRRENKPKQSKLSDEDFSN